MRVTAVDNDIASFEMGDELLNKGVNGITGLDEKDNFAWPNQFCNELLDRVSTLNFGA